MADETFEELDRAQPVPGIGPSRRVVPDLGILLHRPLDVAPPLVVAPEDTLGEVAERMLDRNVGSAVVAEYGRTIGILTSRDMLDAFASRVHSSLARVREWMTADPITIESRASAAAAADLMTEHGIHHLPVVDEDGRPTAILDLCDLVSTSSPAAPRRPRARCR